MHGDREQRQHARPLGLGEPVGVEEGAGGLDCPRLFRLGGPTIDPPSKRLQQLARAMIVTAPQYCRPLRHLAIRRVSRHPVIGFHPTCRRRPPRRLRQCGAVLSWAEGCGMPPCRCSVPVGQVWCRPCTDLPTPPSVIPAKAGISVCGMCSDQQMVKPGKARPVPPCPSAYPANRDSRFRGNDPWMNGTQWRSRDSSPVYGGGATRRSGGGGSRLRRPLLIPPPSGEGSGLGER